MVAQEKKNTINVHSKKILSLPMEKWLFYVKLLQVNGNYNVLVPMSTDY